MKQKLLVMALLLALMVSLAACGGDSTTVVEETSTMAIEATEVVEAETTTEEEKLEFNLVAGEQGEYGELFTVNAGTEFEESYYVYRIPAGTYTATNIGEYMTQINVYSDELIKTEEGWDEYAETFFVELVDVDKSTTIKIEEGQHIHIDAPSKFAFEQK